MDAKSVMIIVLALALIIGSHAAQDDRTYALPGITEADITLLARLIEAEAGGEPYLGKVAVGAVVINRVRHPDFPDTVRGVIYQPNQFYAEGIAKHPHPSAESRRAAEAAARGEDPTGGALYFYNPKTASPHPWWRTRTVLVQIGNHVFLK